MMMKPLNQLKEQILNTLKGGDILFIVPPFTRVSSPFLGVHILQKLAEERGFKTEILYLNLLLASAIGAEHSEYLGALPRTIAWSMLNERLFARSAYGLPPLGKSPEYCADEAMSISGNGPHHKMFHEAEPFEPGKYREVEEICYSFVEEVVPVIASLNYKMIGCSTRIGQTNCSVALINGIKRLTPAVVTLLGGGNCEDEMAEGTASLSDSIDYVFSGESEQSFRDFLEKFADGQLPAQRIIHGQPLQDLDSLPLPDYNSFFQQYQRFLGEHSSPLAVSYETSRGCWWGAKRKCRFCGYKVAYRKKTAQKVIGDLKQIARHYPGKSLFMCDSIMPYSVAKEVLPTLKENKKFPAIFFMLKSNLNLKTLMELKVSGVTHVTPGIEALSTGLLKLMNKGTTAGQNLNLLRYARSVGVYLDWIQLWGFPGDKAEHYEETLRILPLIRHLQPPFTFIHLFLTRFSPYFEKAADFQIDNIRPWTVYNMIYPEWADIDKLAYWYVGDYPCEAHENPQLIKEIADEIALWKKDWKTTHLEMVPFKDYYLVLDNRNNKKEQEVLEHREAKEIMKMCRYTQSQSRERALEKKMAVLEDSWYIPLITASPELLLKLEE
ncbi:MAG: RiPP maturation radical SAM protein 1 [bacterium]|nr:RiPP maturation radical SAM protein 1 [bacterium]